MTDHQNITQLPDRIRRFLPPPGSPQDVFLNSRRCSFEQIGLDFKAENCCFRGAKAREALIKERGSWREEFLLDSSCKNRRRSGATSRVLQGGNGGNSAARRCGIYSVIPKVFSRRNAAQHAENALRGF